jgi:hypothetical protein
MNERKALEVTYTSLDGDFRNPTVRYIRGFQDANSGTPTVGTLDDPRNAGIPLLPDTKDPKIFSFSYRGDVFFLLCRVVTPVVGDPSTEGRWSLIMAPTPPLGAWALLARDITLKANGTAVLANPYGLAQIGNTLYIIEYDTQRIYSLGVNELNGLPDGADFVLDGPRVDLTAQLAEPDAKAQAIIAMTPASGSPIVAALFTVSAVDDPDEPELIHKNGILARLVFVNGVLTYDTKVYVGKNPQELVPVMDKLLIPAIGGMQKAGASNTTNTNISCVSTFGSWSGYGGTAPILVTGDQSGTYDFKAIGASYRQDGQGWVYILMLINNAGFVSTNWQLYRIKIVDLLALNNVNIGSIPAGKIAMIDWGEEDPGWFWELLYETADTSTKDRLWFFRGSAILSCPALAYPDHPVSHTEPSNGSYRYFDFGEKDGNIGGANIDWADLTIETVRQIAAGHSLKRGARAATPAGAAAAAEEEE